MRPEQISLFWGVVMKRIEAINMFLSLFGADAEFTTEADVRYAVLNAYMRGSVSEAEKERMCACWETILRVCSGKLNTSEIDPS